MKNQCPNCKTDLGDLFDEMDRLSKLRDEQGFVQPAKCCTGTHVFQTQAGMYYFSYRSKPEMIGAK